MNQKLAQSASLTITDYHNGLNDVNELIKNYSKNDKNDVIDKKTARELNLKIITRRQLEKVLREIKLIGSDSQDFNSLSKSNGVDAIVVTSVSFPKTTCMSVGLKLLGTSEENKAEVINIAKPFLVKIQGNELDLTGCDD